MRRDKITRVNVKLITTLCSCVKVNKAVVASHDPDELTSFGFRFTNDWMVWQKHKDKCVLEKGFLCCFLCVRSLIQPSLTLFCGREK